MAEEIQEAVQIIRVAYDGIEIAMKVGSGGIAAMQKLSLIHIYLEETLMAACDLMAMEFAKAPQVVDVDSLYKDADEKVEMCIRDRSWLAQLMMVAAWFWYCFPVEAI